MKLCAYTICKNESKHVDTWVKALQDEVDYICVLDTGSTDDTLEKFKQYPNVIVGQKIITPWRFDTARNEAAKLIPEDTDVAMTVDLDETYRPGFKKHIEEAFNQGYNLMSGYKVTFEDGQQTSYEGSELSLPIVADIKNWHWEYPVHEYPKYYDEMKIKEIVLPEVICEHRPDSSKSRGQYIDILKRWYESEDPPSAICVEKYSVELFARGRSDEGAKVLEESIDKCVNTNDYTGRVTLYRNALNAAVLFLDQNRGYDKVKKYIDMAKTSGIKSRALYIFETDLEIANEHYDKALEACLNALNVTEMDPKPYVESSDLFINGVVEDKLASIFFELKNYKEAFKYSKIALDAQPNNENYNKTYELCRRMVENKICVYTTCYNESKFIDKWLENNKNADHIVVLIHDCKDDSEEKFKKAGVSIGYGFYPDWRFDKGKNDALHLAYALAPECNIFVFTSLDEYWDDGWDYEVKKNWGTDTQQCWYNFVQSHDELGHETGASYFNWMISKDLKWHWEYPIHEAIIYGDNEPVVYINLFDKVKLQHWPDSDKPRNYMKLHELRYSEYKNDISFLYLVRENILQWRMKEAYDLAKTFDHEHTDLCAEENAFIWTMQGICCEYLEKYDEAIDCYTKSYALDNNLRTPLVRAGVIYAKCGAYHTAEKYLQKALNETHRTFSWLEDPWDWRSKPFYWLSYIKLKLNKEEEAIGYATFAEDIDPGSGAEEILQKALNKYGK